MIAGKSTVKRAILTTAVRVAGPVLNQAIGADPVGLMTMGLGIFNLVMSFKVCYDIKKTKKEILNGQMQIRNDLKELDDRLTYLSNTISLAFQDQAELLRAVIAATGENASQFRTLSLMMRQQLQQIDASLESIDDRLRQQGEDQFQLDLRQLSETFGQLQADFTNIGKRL